MFNYVSKKFVIITHKWKVLLPATIYNRQLVITTDYETTIDQKKTIIRKQQSGFAEKFQPRIKVYNGITKDRKKYQNTKKTNLRGAFKGHIL